MRYFIEILLSLLATLALTSIIVLLPWICINVLKLSFLTTIFIGLLPFVVLLIIFCISEFFRELFLNVV